MELQNKVMLITYANSLGKNLKELKQVLDRHFAEEIGGVHILPFFPSSADRGFAPIRYDKVDEEFGSFEDVAKIGNDRCLMFDFMVNHISRQSEYFRDFQKNKDNSPYKDMFIRYKDFWPGGQPTKEQIDAIYKRKPRAPYTTVQFADGSTEKVWCTFDPEQIDLNVGAPITQEFIKDTLANMCKKGAAVIRLDAFAYTVKKPGASCFFQEPEIWELLKWIAKAVKPFKAEILPEIHEHYTMQLRIAQKGFWTYDFALPMLVLHALYTGEGKRLKHWLDICPRRQFTTLDTHDGIGVVDAADLLTAKEIEQTKDLLFEKGANVKRIYNTEAYNNLDIYQLNCTYYSALGNNDEAYLLARAIQFFAPGIPQVYYVGLLAGENDIDLMEQTRQGRDINRHYYSTDEIEKNMKRPVVQELCNLMKLRNRHPAFNIEGRLETEVSGTRLTMTRTYNGAKAVLDADLKTHHYRIIAL